MDSHSTNGATSQDPSANNSNNSNSASNGRSPGSDETKKRTRPPLPSLPKIEFAPLNIPLERRLQTLAVVLFLSLHLMCILLLGLFVCVPLFWPLLIPYLIWMFVFDKNTQKNGKGRAFPWFRKLTFPWVFLREYFPARIIKTAELNPQKNYIFGYHPHGIIGLGAVINFGTEANHISKLFPGVNIRVLTLGVNFKFPFYRDYLMALNFADVGKTSIRNILGSGPGASCLIVVGGAAEALDARPGVADLTLASRKGFVREAIINNACLVPVFSFGENDIYSQAYNPPGSRLRKIQEGMKSALGFTFPIILGRGIFNYTFGILPHRRPIVSVVGKPIEVPHIAHPTDKDVDEIHSRYIQALQELYDDYKDMYSDPTQRRADLRLVA